MLGHGDVEAGREHLLDVTGHGVPIRSTLHHDVDAGHEAGACEDLFRGLDVHHDQASSERPCNTFGLQQPADDEPATPHRGVEGELVSDPEAPSAGERGSRSPYSLGDRIDMAAATS